ncbi:MAG: ABC transporter substrate-binding protein, partial [Nitrospinae bacterium]|nr:ABC transporter substrate-binding protein [Nitrospinota bacterium]
MLMALALVALGLMAVPMPSGAGAPGPEVVKPTGELRIALAFLGGQRLIPWVEFISGGIKQYMMLVYDYLVGCTDDGQLSADGGIAEKWAEAPDKLSWTFWLHKGVRFHTGTEVTAEDVKFSVESLFDPKATAGLLGPTRTAFKELEIKDPHTVVIHLKRPAIFLPWNFSCATGGEGMILPAKYFEKVGADGFARNPVGSGPYKVAKNTLGSSIQLEALDRHWRDGVPKYKTVTFMLVPEVRAAGFNVFSKLNDQVVAVYMQQQWDLVPVADKRVRQALNLAID